MSESIAINCDCMEYMRTMPDKAFDLAVVDPPYGIGIDRHKENRGIKVIGGGGQPFGCKKNQTIQCREKQSCESKFYPAFDDSSPPNEEYFRELERVSRHRIIWGGNYFLDYLGSASCMIVWDKGRRGLDQADCEIAWTDLKGQSRVFNFKWNGMLQEDMKHKEKRIHATQKPVALYTWLFKRYAKRGDRILDTHLGSGSSRIAAYDLGLDFVGCELDPTYFKLQEERFNEYAAQQSFFILDGGN